MAAGQARTDAVQQLSELPSATPLGGSGVVGEAGGAAETRRACSGGADGAHRKVCIVGVGGPSGCGKTSLAAAIAREFASPVKVLSEDEYFDESRMPTHPSWGLDYEHPEGVDSALLAEEAQRMATTLGTACAVPPKLPVRVLEETVVCCQDYVQPGHAGRDLGTVPVVVVLEGFLLFHDAAVARLCDCQIWLDIDEEEALRRRYQRDFAGLHDYKDVARWYKEVVWPNYLKYRPAQLANASSALQLDGETPQECLAAAAAVHIREHLASNGSMSGSLPSNSAPRGGASEGGEALAPLD